MKCGTKTCEKSAVGVVYWPGSAPLPMCHSCGLRATSIANVLGFTLPVESLTPVLDSTARVLSYAQTFGC